MPGIPSIRTSRTGIDTQTGGVVDMSFDSDYVLHKVTRGAERGIDGTITHGQSYPPQCLIMGEIPLTADYNGDTETDLSYGNVHGRELNSGTFYEVIDGIDDDYIDVNMLDYESIHAHVFLEPIDNATVTDSPLIKNGYPMIRVGGEDGDPDYKRSMHSYYDTFKVNKTGTLSISVDAETFSSGDAGTTDWVGPFGNLYVVQKTEVSYAHNLGYVPMFAPFVNYEIIAENYYGWLDQWNNNGVWSVGRGFLINNIVNDGSSNYYKCIKSHTSASTDEPNIGANWATYWETHTPPTTQIPTTIVLNDLEDVKYIFGGVSYQNFHIIRYYATDTDIKLVLYRMTWDVETMYPPSTNGAMQALDLSVKYTLFDNQADEVFDLNP